jgi:hypothetical protein
LGSGNQDVGYVSLAETIDQRFEQAVGSDCLWPRLHHLFDPGLVVCAERGSAKATNHHRIAVDYDTDIPLVSQHGSDLTDGGVGPTGGHLGSGCVGDPRRLVLGAFQGEAGRLPVGDAVDVVVNAGESECFEPARGSWRHVSEAVVAVDDHRFVPRRDGDGLAGELFEGDADRSGYMGLVVLASREHIHHLCPFGLDEPQYLLTVSDDHHRSYLSRPGREPGAVDG